MEPISFKEVNNLSSIGDEKDKDSVVVPYCKAVHPDSRGSFVITRYKLSPQERERVALTGEVHIISPGIKPNPMLPTAMCPFKVHGYKPVQG